MRAKAWASLTCSHILGSMSSQRQIHNFSFLFACDIAVIAHMAAINHGQMFHKTKCKAEQLVEEASKRDDGGQKVIRVLSAPSGWVDLLLGAFYTPQEPPFTVPPDRTRQSEQIEAQGHGGGFPGSGRGGSSWGRVDDKATRRLPSFPLFWPRRNLRLLLLLLLLLSVVQTSSCLGSSAGVRDKQGCVSGKLIGFKRGPDVPFDLTRIRNFGQIKTSKHDWEGQRQVRRVTLRSETRLPAHAPQSCILTLTGVTQIQFADCQVQINEAVSSLFWKNVFSLKENAELKPQMQEVGLQLHPIINILVYCAGDPHTVQIYYVAGSIQ